MVAKKKRASERACVWATEQHFFFQSEIYWKRFFVGRNGNASVECGRDNCCWILNTCAKASTYSSPLLFHFSHFAHRWRRRRKIFHPSSTHIFPEKKKKLNCCLPVAKSPSSFLRGWKGGGEMSRRIFNPDPEPTASVDRRSLWSRQGKKVFLKKLHQKRFDKHFFSQKL